MRLRMLSGVATIATLALVPWIAEAQPAQGTSGQGAAQQSQAQGAGGLATRPAQGSAAAQQQQGAQGNRQIAQQCLRELTAFGRQMEGDGYWLSGYRRGYGWGTYGMQGPAGRAGLATAPAPATPAGTTADARTGAESRPGSAAAQSGGAVGPWGNMNWQMPPGQELGTLYSAAAVLAHRGDEQACQTVLGELKQAYGEYAQQLRQAGIQPGQVVGYRKQQLAAATPVTQINHAFRADAITGTDVRNPRDEYLGSIEDVIINPDNGQISYVILSRGGFLGIGEDYVAVPWQRLRATPNMDVFVLDTTEQALQRAPKVDPEAFASRQTYDRRRQEIDSYWQQQGKSG